MEKLVEIMLLAKFCIREIHRLNASYQWRTMQKNVNFLMYYRRKHIIASLMVICGFPSLLGHHRTNLLVFSGAHAVLYYSLFQCF